MSSARRKPAPRPRRPAGSARRVGSGSLRVIAGAQRGRRLEVPVGDEVRPTADRVRQATFNALESLGAVEGAAVLDAFAGSGALGIEALSRGAAEATFCDTSPAARTAITANLAALALVDRARVVAAPALAVLAGGESFDLVLLDPPYAFEDWDDLLVAVGRSLAPDGVVVVESDREVSLPAALVGLRSRRYGSTVVLFATPAGAPR